MLYIWSRFLHDRSPIYSRQLECLLMRPYDVPPSCATGRRMLKSIWPCFASIASSRTQNLVASMTAKQPWGFTDDLLVLKSTTSISFASIEKIDSWARAAFAVALGSWCKPDRVHSETPCGASTEQALTASMKCSNTTLRVHSPVYLSFLNVSLGRSARPVNLIMNTSGS
jgi:hypothetical protein